MASYYFDAPYDRELQERAARIIMLWDTGRARGLATEVLGCQKGASRQSRLDHAIRLTFSAQQPVEYTPEEIDVLISAIWVVDNDGFAVPQPPLN